MKIQLSCLILLSIFFTSCTKSSNESLFSSCNSPKTGRISGVILDNYSNEPIEGVEIFYDNFSWDSEQRQKKIVSGDNGVFSVTASGCSFTDHLLHFRSARHPDYDGYIHHGHENEIDVHLYKERDFKIIFEDFALNDSTQVFFWLNYCLYIEPCSTCYSTFEYGDFNPNVSNVMDLRIPQGVTLEVSYALDRDAVRTEVFVDTEGKNEFSIFY